MSPRRELLAFSAALAVIVAGFFAPSLFGGQGAESSRPLAGRGRLRRPGRALYEPANRLLMDPVSSSSRGWSSTGR